MFEGRKVVCRENIVTNSLENSGFSYTVNSTTVCDVEKKKKKFDVMLSCCRECMLSNMVKIICSCFQ